MAITTETLNLLFLLMPGFIASVIFRCIVPSRKLDIYNKSFEIITFSLSIYVLVSIFTEWTPVLQVTNNSDQIAYNLSNNFTSIGLIVFFSLAWPTALGCIVFHDYHMKLFRGIRITYSSSRESAWNDAFIEQRRFVIIHLKDGRRICGHPLYYSNHDNNTYIYLYKPAWIVDQEYISCVVHGTLIKGDQIEFVDFMYEKDEQQ